MTRIIEGGVLSSPQSLLKTVLESDVENNRHDKIEGQDKINDVEGGVEKSTM